MGSIEGNSLRLGGKQGEAVNLDTLKAGVKKTDVNKTIFEKFDKNNNGILEKDEIENLKQNIMQYGDDGVISNREAKKILKAQGFEKPQTDELFDFLNSIQADSENIDDTFYSLFEGVEAANVKYKKDENGFVKTSSFNRGTGALIQENFNNGIQDRTVYYDEAGNITGEVIKQGTKTTEKDASGRIMRETVDKGNGLAETVQYEYDGDGATPFKITKIGLDGSVVVTDGDGNNIFSSTEAEHSEPNDGKTVLENGRVLQKTETGATIQEPGKEPVEIKYDDDGNILSNAKSGENFEQTAERLGIKKGTPEFEKFKELNSKAAKNGWFVVGAEVKVPAGMEDKVNLEGLNVDAKAEAGKFADDAVKNADISKYNETNTEKRTLDNNTTWWNLAKQSLVDEGTQEPSSKDIAARMNELQKLNAGKQPSKGSEITMPKPARSNSETASVTETTETTQTETDPVSQEATELTPQEKYSTENLKKTYPQDKYDITTEHDGSVTVTDKATGKAVILAVIDGGWAFVTRYNSDGKEIEFTQENPNGVVVLRETKDPDTGEFVSSEEFDENGRKFQSTTFYKDKDGNSQSEVTDYDKNGEPIKIYYTEEGRPIRYPLAEALRDDIYAKTSIGLPTTGKDIGKHIEKINDSNVQQIMDAYKKINEDDESLVSAIIAERGLPKEERMQYLAHIKEALIKSAKGKYTEDISSKFDNEVRYQMRKVGFADGEYLDSYINKLNSRNNSVNNTSSKPNGQIDEEFSQGNTGDCWLVASIKAISQTPKGLQILNDSINVDDKGNVTVTLKGVGKSYTITPDELAGNNQLTSGDADIRALEIAMDKYFEEERGVNERIDLNGNQAQVAFQILTGKGGRNVFSNSYGRIPDFWFSDSQIDKFNNTDHVAVVSAHNKKNLTFAGPEEEQVTLHTNHAYTVKGSDKDNVYLINPWDTSKVITVPREQFKDFFNAVDEFDL